ALMSAECGNERRSCDLVHEALLTWTGWSDVEWRWVSRLRPDPAIVTDDPIVAAVKRLTVTTFIRRGVSHVACCACSHDRAPVAPAIAAIAHAAHMGSTVLRSAFPSREVHQDGSHRLGGRRAAGARGRGD